MRRPSFQFYPADWRNDAGLKLCSMGARGLWIEMICIMHASEPYGHLFAAGRPLDARDLAKLVGESEKDVKRWLDELVRNNVCSTGEEGIFSRRMVRDEVIRDKRAAGGEAGSEFGHLGAEHGKKGGRPRKERGDENPPSQLPLQPPIEPPPSSSSSSSTSVNTSPSLRSGEGAAKPQRPPGRKRSEARTLATYLAECRAAKVKPVPDDHAVRRWAADAGLTPDMLQIAWLQFRDRYTEGEKGKSKRYRDWPAHFATAVKDNWFRLWYTDDKGGVCWSSNGMTHKAVLDARAAQMEDQHDPA